MKAERPCEKHPDRAAVSFCIKCGAAMCPECERPYGGRPYCVRCFKKRGRETKEAAQGGVAAVEKARRIKDGIMSAIREPRPDEPQAPKSVIPKEVARVLARLVDFVIVFALALPLAWPLRVVSISLMSDVGGIGSDLSLYIAVLLTGTIYFIALEWRAGKTAGKWLLGLKVVTYGTGNPLGFLQALWRWIGFLAGMIWALVGIWAITSIVYWSKFLGTQMKPGERLLMTAVAVAGIVIFSLGLLITFVGKYKRGFHDLLGGTIVDIDTRTKKRMEKRQ